MVNDPFKDYEQRSNEFAISQSAVRLIVNLTRHEDVEGHYDNDSIIRIGKDVQSELVRLVAEIEGKDVNRG